MFIAFIFVFFSVLARRILAANWVFPSEEDCYPYPRPLLWNFECLTWRPDIVTEVDSILPGCKEGNLCLEMPNCVARCMDKSVVSSFQCVPEGMEETHIAGNPNERVRRCPRDQVCVREVPQNNTGDPDAWDGKARCITERWYTGELFAPITSFDTLESALWDHDAGYDHNKGLCTLVGQDECTYFGTGNDMDEEQSNHPHYVHKLNPPYDWNYFPHDGSWWREDNPNMGSNWS